MARPQSVRNASKHTRTVIAAAVSPVMVSLRIFESYESFDEIPEYSYFPLEKRSRGGLPHPNSDETFLPAVSESSEDRKSLLVHRNVVCTLRIQWFL